MFHKLYHQIQQFFRARKKIAFYKRFISKGDLCFDIGANIGEKSKLFLKCGAKVVAFEPQKSCLLKLQEITSSNLFIEPCAITNDYETRTFHISNISDISTFSNKFMRLYASEICQWNRFEDIQCYPITHYFKKYGIPHYCKIDVEGLELEIITSIKQKIPFIEFESTSEFLEESIKCVAHLAAMNYHFNIIKDSSFSFTSQQWLKKEAIIAKMKDFATINTHANIFCKSMCDD